jgi:hypothetical protein
MTSTFDRLAFETAQMARIGWFFGHLAEAGWVVQSRDQMNRGAGLGVAVREFATGIGPVDYALFVD